MTLTELPGVHDQHVHLGLIDVSRLAGGVVTRVTDLGWDPHLLAPVRASPPEGVRIDVAGRFHGAPGGYPSGRSWAPAGAVRAVQSSADAAAAVAEAIAAGSSVIKVSLHHDFPLLERPVLHALSAAAAAAGVHTAAHVEGPGLAAYALECGVRELVHIPWTERLDPGVLRDFASARVVWVSTLAIHTGEALECALDNGRRYLEAGGSVRYGTDLGNGALPLGLNPVEVARCEQLGLTGAALRTAICDASPDASRFHSDLPMPATAADLCAWFASARRSLGDLSLRG